jgi:hypothetical protein
MDNFFPLPFIEAAIPPFLARAKKPDVHVTRPLDLAH